MFSNHLAGGAELLEAAPAIVALTAGDQVMETDSIARAEAFGLGTGGLNDSGDLMAEGERKMVDRGFAGAIMSVGMADAGCFDTDEHVKGAEVGDLNFLRFQRLACFG
jgi:hypothetical protein